MYQCAGKITLTFYVVVSTLPPTHCIGTKKKEFIPCSQNVLNNAKTCCLLKQAVHCSVVTATIDNVSVFKCICKMSSIAIANK